MDLLLINAVPFLIALALATPFVREQLNQSMQTALTALPLAGLFIMLLTYLPLIEGDRSVQRSIDWMPEIGLYFSFYLDGLAMLFGLVVTGIGTAVFVYSGFYFEDSATRCRFNMMLMAFTGAMLGVVLSGNLITMFIMWELTSITSFLLIGFKGDKYEAARAGASRALVVTGVGGLALLAGVMLLSVAAADIQGGTLLFNAEISDLLKTKGLTDHSWYGAIAVLVMIGAFTKSAQFPFHFWLPGAMSAPTPASAFLHSATMVKAGIYLLARLYPVMYGTDLWTNGLMIFGLATMLVGAIFAIKQRDLKGLLAYTTITQLGALVLLIGMPDYIGFKAAMVGILAHALYKAALFLSVGSIDHSFGTRNIDNLGGVAKLMPVTTGVVVISAISMAGIPFWFGFVAKEVLIAAAMDVTAQTIVTGLVFISGALTATAGFILIWDVFFVEPRKELHYHAMPPLVDAGPAGLAVGSLTFGFLLDPLIIPLVDPAVPKAFKLELFPGFITEFYISLTAIVLGFALFAVRKTWLPAFRDLPFSGAQIYQYIISAVEWSGDQLLRSQSGKLRYYLISILGVLAGVIISSGLLVDLANSEQILPNNFSPQETDVLDFLLLILAIGAALMSVLTRRHLHAVLAVGVMGYAVAGIFLIEQAPDVALVQFMVETLLTVLVIIILSRTSQELREEAMARLWDRSFAGSIWRDVLIAGVIGFCVFIFTLIAMTNRAERDTIAQWHVDNAEPEVGVTDIVSAILTDFRGTDTLVEIGVFAMAALGIRAIFSVIRDNENPLKTAEFGAVVVDEVNLSTPFTRLVATVVLPITVLIAAAHILYGANAPGDGFTAGIIAGLGIALWYLVFGYQEVRKRLPWLNPMRFISGGLLLALINASAPILFGEGFMGLLKIDDFSPAGLKFSTTLIFEIAIALTVYGSVGVMLEAIARPQVEQRDMSDNGESESYTTLTEKMTASTAEGD